MLNIAGPSYDFGAVLFAVLQECEHRRRGFLPNEAESGLMAAARRKLDEIEESYRECGGTRLYWEELEREVLATAMPQYVAAAVEQNRLERGNYDLWRGGDALSRVAIGLGGLLLGLLIIALPLPPLQEDVVAIALALSGFFYPEIRRLLADYRHTRTLNRLVAEAEKYQKNQRLHYVSTARLDEELRSAGPEVDAADAGPRPAEPTPRRRSGDLRVVKEEPPGDRPPDRSRGGRDRA